MMASDTGKQQGGKASNAHAGSRTRVTSMGDLYDAATLHAPCYDPEIWVSNSARMTRARESQLTSPL